MLYLGFLMSVFLDYVKPGSYLPVINAIKANSLIPIIVLIGTVFYKAKIDNKELFTHPNSKWLLFFLFLLGVSVLIADVTLYSYNIFKVVLGFMFWYYIAVKLIDSRERIKGLFNVFVISHLVLLALNPQVILNPATRSYIRDNPFLGDGNDFSLSVCITIPMCIYLFLNAKKFYLKALYAAAILILIFAIVGTQSRGATVALACVFLYLWWAGRQKILGILFISAALLVVVNYAPPVYFERLNSITNYENEGSAQGRIIAWKTAIRMAKKYPLTGVGTGHFPVKLGTEFRPPEFGIQNLPWLTAHSVYFLIIGELGVPGITFLLMMLITNYFRNSSYSKEARGSPGDSADDYRVLFIMLNASLIAFAVGGAFLSVAYYPHLYVLAGIFTAAQVTYLREKNDNAAVIITKPAWHEQSPESKNWYDDNK